MHFFCYAYYFNLIFLFTKCRIIYCCTNLIVTPAASSDGSLFIAYNADDTELMGLLYHYPASKTNETGMRRKIYNWDTGAFLGDISEANVTYNVVGNTNEYGLVIGETTWSDAFGGAVKEGAILDYGSLIYVTLQRAKTSREAIHTMVDLLDTYGYASPAGESFSIADRITGEAWLMEFVGRRDEQKGVVYVARRIPDGMIAAHANLARITTFPRNDPDNCIYTEDVIELARKWNLYDGPDDDFSFSDVFNPVTPESARYGDARVWALYSALTSDEEFESSYLDYAMGRNLSKRMPLWIKPKSKVSLDDVRELMANHYEGTALDSRKYVAAGIFEAPYRPRPYTWYYEGEQYVNERSVAVEKTGWNFIAQIRPFMPIEISTVLWFGVDDSSTSPRFPVYSSSTKLSSAYYGRGKQDGVFPPLMTLDMTKAFWVQNMVSNFVYFRYKDAYPMLKEELDRVHKKFINELRMVDEDALRIYENGSIDDAIRKVTDYGIQAGDEMHSHWLQFYGVLFAKFRDFVIMKPDDKNPNGGCVTYEVGYDDKWKERIVFESGDHFRLDRFPILADTASAEVKDKSLVSWSALKNMFLILQGCACIIVIGYICLGSMCVSGQRKNSSGTEMPFIPSAVPVETSNAEEGKCVEKGKLTLIDYGSLNSPRSVVL